MKRIDLINQRYPLEFQGMAEMPFLEWTGYIKGPEAGLRQGNGDLETSFWNDAHELTWSVGKNDVWDRRYFGDHKRIFTLSDLTAAAMTGKLPTSEPVDFHRPADLGHADTAYASLAAYDFPCPKPVGQLIIRSSDFTAPAHYLARLGCGDGVMRITARQGDARLDLTRFVCAERPVMAIRGRYENARSAIRLSLYRHRDTTVMDQPVALAVRSRPPAKPDYGTRRSPIDPGDCCYSPLAYDYASDAGQNGPLDAPEAGVDGPFFWIRQRFPAESTYPEGFEYVWMAFLPGLTYTAEAQRGVQHAGSQAIIKTLTDEEIKKLHGAYHAKRLAARRVNEAPGVEAAVALTPASGVEFICLAAVVTSRDAADPFAAARQALTEAAACGWDGLMAEQREWWGRFWSASWVETSLPEFDEAWISTVYTLGWQARADKTLHFNACAHTFSDAPPWHGDYHLNEMWLWPTLIVNHPESLEPWLQLIEEMLPMAQRHAREVFDCPGCCFPLTHIPRRGERVLYQCCVLEFGMEMTAMVLQMFWHYYQYTGDIEFLRARGYPMLVEGARFYAAYVRQGEDGCYHVIPTVSQENWYLTPNFEYNRDSVGALGFIGYHLRAAAQAADILGRDADEAARWRQIAARLAPYPTQTVAEGEVFVDVRSAPFRPTEINTAANLRMALYGDDVHLDGDPRLLEIARRTYRLAGADRPHYQAALELRLGLPWPHTIVTAEHFLMSSTGRIRLFQAVPPDFKGRFERFLARGGFEVSATYDSGAVTELRIRSLAGQPCVIQHPWPGQALRIWDEETLAWTPAREKELCVTFETMKGHSYRLEKDVSCP